MEFPFKINGNSIYFGPSFCVRAAGNKWIFEKAKIHYFCTVLAREGNPENGMLTKGNFKNQWIFGFSVALVEILLGHLNFHLSGGDLK
jgi:hypothetical protein